MKLIGTIDAQPEFKPGDLPPKNAGYLCWHEWAEVQHRAGIKQVVCGRCCKFKTPQELSKLTDTTPAIQTQRGKKPKKVVLTSAVCLECAERKPYENL